MNSGLFAADDYFVRRSFNSKPSPPMAVNAKVVGSGTGAAPVMVTKLTLPALMVSDP